jgi:hypothetical protein
MTTVEPEVVTSAFKIACQSLKLYHIIANLPPSATKRAFPLNRMGPSLAGCPLLPLKVKEAMPSSTLAVFSTMPVLRLKLALRFNEPSLLASKRAARTSLGKLAMYSRLYGKLDASGHSGCLLDIRKIDAFNGVRNTGVALLSIEPTHIFINPKS